MNIKFLGTGGYDDIHCGTSSAIVSGEFGNVLIDCGPPIYARLKELNLHEQIDYVLLTHLHGDHMGSIFSLVVKNYLDRKITILVPNEYFKRQLEQLFGLWFQDYSDKVVFVSLENVQGIQAIDTFGKHSVGIQTFAYVFEENNKIIYYSGDLNDVEVTKSFLSTTDDDKEIEVYHEVTRNEQGKKVHCYYKDIQQSLHMHNIHLYHCDHLKKPEDCILPCVAEKPDLLFH